MKSKLKTLFSPRNMVVWIFIILLIITLPEITRPSMSQTEAIVTLLCVDKVDDNYEISASILAPSQDKTMNTQIYSCSGITLADALTNLSLTIGKDIGLAQCEIIALGNNICTQGVMPALDFFTRTKQVGRNAVLINFTCTGQDFAKAISDLNKNKSLKLDDIMNANDKYMLTQVSNIESFYKGYYSDISISFMPELKVQSEETNSAIEVSSVSSESGGSNTGSSGGGSSGGGEEKKYLVNDGTTVVFKNGKKDVVLNPEMAQKVNLVMNPEQRGRLIVKNVTDELFDDATVIFKLSNKSISFNPSFQNGKPVFNIDIDLVVLIKEIQQANQGKEFLQRNKEFLTPTLIEKLKQTTINNLNEVVEFSKQNEVDLLNAYKYFYAFKNKEFKEYLKSQEKYLDGIDYQFTVKVSSTY